MTPNLWVEVLIAVLAFAGSVAGSYFAHRKTTALIEYRLEQLEKKVDLHNSVIERVYNLEKTTAVIEEKIEKD